MIEIFQVDSFTDKPFTGNPAGVCILEDENSAEVMKNIALEMAVPETAFLSLHTMRLRWFSPEVEVDLCGHATLATAAVLHYKNIIKEEQKVEFNTLSGVLSVKAGPDYIEMDFPGIPVEETGINPIKLELLGIRQEDVMFWGKAGEKDLIHLKDERLIREVNPDFIGLRDIPGRAVIVTAESSLSNFDFISRNFAPWVGVNEDPVTGSSHCALATYWNDRLGKSDMTAFQASERGGVVRMVVSGKKLIKLSGKAAIIFQGTLRI